MALCILNKLFYNEILIVNISTKKFSKNLRYVLIDTLESHNIGEIIEEGTGEEYFQFIIQPRKIFIKIKKMKIIFRSLGLLEGIDYTYKWI